MEGLEGTGTAFGDGPMPHGLTGGNRCSLWGRTCASWTDRRELAQPSVLPTVLPGKDSARDGTIIEEEGPSPMAPWHLALDFPASGTE